MKLYRMLQSTLFHMGTNVFPSCNRHHSVHKNDSHERTHPMGRHRYRHHRNRTHLANNMLTVPFSMISTLISLVAWTVILSSYNLFSPSCSQSLFIGGFDLNWNRNESPHGRHLNDCQPSPYTFRSIVCIIVCFTLRTIFKDICLSKKEVKVSSLSFTSPPLSSSSSSDKLAFPTLLIGVPCLFILFLLVISQIQTANAQRMEFLNSNQIDSYEHEDEEDNEQTAYPTIKALINSSVGLPCNISQTKEENSIKLILWYKNNVLGTPIYSIDARSHNISQARHFVAPPYQDRATFELNLSARIAILFVKPLRGDDDGHYICRVDFRWTRTTISTVKLDVIIPPQQLRVIQRGNQWPPNRASIGTSTSTSSSSSSSSTSAHWVNKQLDTNNNGSGSNWSQHQHVVYSTPTSSLSILHNGSMINEIATAHQPEETELTLFCDSIGARPRSIVKWYRLEKFEKAMAKHSNITSQQLYAELQSTEDNALELIDDSFYQMNHTEFMEVSSNESFVNWWDGINTIAIENWNASSSIVRNELNLGMMTDRHHRQLYLCRSSNSNLSRPLDSIVQLEIYTGPKLIQIRQQISSKDLDPSTSNFPSMPFTSFADHSNNDDQHVHNRTLHSMELLDYYLNIKQQTRMEPLHLRSGYDVELICQTNGSWPLATIEWKLRDFRTNIEKDITHLSSSYVEGLNTFSQLRLVPKFTDNRASLICRALNIALRDSLSNASNGDKHGNVQQSNSKINGNNIGTNTNGNISTWNGHHHHHHRMDHYGEPIKRQTDRFGFRLPFQLETSVLLDVNYKPIVSIKLLSGEQMYHEVSMSSMNDTKLTQLLSSSSPSRMKTKTIDANLNYYQFVENQEIFFNCSINANPPVHLVHWFFNGIPLQTDLVKGLIITNSNRTMIVSSVTKTFSGYYHCSGTNLLGETNSDQHQVDVLFEPQCRTELEVIQYHQLGDFVQLKCQVLANPIDDIRFMWQFNDTLYNVDYGAENRSIDGMFDGIGHVANWTTTTTTTINRKMTLNDEQKWKTNVSPSTAYFSSSSSTSSINQQEHMVTNVIRVELKKWANFGHFSCAATNHIGKQKEACKWHIVPEHYHSHHHQDERRGEHSNGSKHHHRYHHRHHQTKSDVHHFGLAGTLNNCQIIESSNAVVIKCPDSFNQHSDAITQDILTSADNGEKRPSLLNTWPIDHVVTTDQTIAGHVGIDSNRVNQAELPLSRLTYHVQVFQLADSHGRVNHSLPTNNRNRSYDTSQHYFPQIDQPEPGKRVAANSFPTSATSDATSLATIIPDSTMMVMDTINFTNPLFIITNLTASTNYMFKIWSSKITNQEAIVDQVNITVRTRSIEDGFNSIDDDIRSDMSTTFALLLKLGNRKLMLMLAMVAFVCVIFVALTVTYAIVKIRAILDVRKARRAVNVNESINALETALCEMRPDMLESDLKTNKSPFTSETYRPYISVDNVDDADCLRSIGGIDQTRSCGSTLNRPFVDSSLLTYQNYLYPSMTTANGNHIKLNSSDEESASNRTIMTSTDSNYTCDSGGGSGGKSRLELSFDKRCYQSSMAIEQPANVVFCMETQLTPSNSSHAFLIPETYQSFPLQLHIVPEGGDELESNHPQSVTMLGVATSSVATEKCAYLTSNEANMNTTMTKTTTTTTATATSTTNMVNPQMSITVSENGDSMLSPKSIQTTV